MVHKTCCKAVSVNISFAHRPTLQTTEGHSHTAWVLFLPSQHTSWNNLWSSVNPTSIAKRAQRRGSIVHVYGSFVVKKGKFYMSAQQRPAWLRWWMWSVSRSEGGHHRSAPLPFLPSVSAGWASTPDRVWGGRGAQSRAALYMLSGVRWEKISEMHVRYWESHSAPITWFLYRDVCFLFAWGLTEI